MERFSPSLCPRKTGVDHLKISYYVQLKWGKVVDQMRTGSLKENLPYFQPWKKKKELLPLPLPAALIVCRGWGGRGIPAAAGQYPGNCLLFPSLSPFYEGDNVDIQWVPCASFGPPGPLTWGFYTVAHHLPTLPGVPPHPNQGASASPFPRLFRKKLHALFSQGLKRNMCNVMPGK